jgi:peptide/nickel transport system ATP-binding protein
MKQQFHICISKCGFPLVNIKTFELSIHKINFLFGESGIGKSLISKALYGLLDPQILQIQINRTDYESYHNQPKQQALRRNGFFVFQEPSSHLNPLRTLAHQLREGDLATNLGEQEALTTLWQGKSLEQVSQILRIYPKPHRPSGGEKQRILLTMAFKKILLFQQNTQPDEPHLFIFDEPTGSLDNRYRDIFLKKLLDYYKRRPFTAVFITHDYSIISEIAKYPKRLQSKIVYHELREQQGTLIQHNFDPGTYIAWVNRELQDKFVSKKHGNKVLHFHASYTVFGKQMKITRNGKIAPLTIHQGEMVYVKAASGVGKTTLAKIIMGLQPADKFEFTLCDKVFSETTPRKVWKKFVWGKHAGLVFQHADEALNLEASVREIFRGLPLEKPLNDDDLRNLLSDIFDSDIDDTFLSKKTGLLSGGQKQRLNLIRTLLLKSDLIILDEPFNGLDLESIQKIIAIIKRKIQDDAAILMISHNEEIVESIVPLERIYHLTTQ